MVSVNFRYLPRRIVMVDFFKYTCSRSAFRCTPGNPTGSATSSRGPRITRDRRRRRTLLCVSLVYTRSVGRIACGLVAHPRGRLSLMVSLPWGSNSARSTSPRPRTPWTLRARQRASPTPTNCRTADRVSLNRRGAHSTASRLRRVRELIGG